MLFFYDPITEIEINYFVLKSLLAVNITGPMIVLPYFICFLFHLANWFSWLHPASASRRLIARVHRRSPHWLRRTLAWCWPNVGLFLHLHRLLVIYMLALGFLPRNAAVMSLANDANRAKFFGIIYKLSATNNVKVLPLIIYKILIMTCESYDLRAVILVAFFLDGPVWFASWKSVGMTNAFGCVISSEAVTIFTQILLATLRKHRDNFLIAQNASTISVGVGEPAAASLTTIPNKKSN